MGRDGDDEASRLHHFELASAPICSKFKKNSMSTNMCYQGPTANSIDDRLVKISNFSLFLTQSSVMAVAVIDAGILDDEERTESRRTFHFVVPKEEKKQYYQLYAMICFWIHYDNRFLKRQTNMTCSQPSKPVRSRILLNIKKPHVAEPSH
ncbi:hypothetical protein RF11_09280 [Thelohanellus kitauei]|uniref:Uncharacterized protein n=1 Tax=Thelohanellus kitauei TaxID=669202 RepID=A0A0C2MKE4_THEKT|nr:hypothetical protein RF11_09280 [Thelohanellus kitauei]